MSRVYASIDMTTGVLMIIFTEYGGQRKLCTLLYGHLSHDCLLENYSSLFFQNIAGEM